MAKKTGPAITCAGTTIHFVIHAGQMHLPIVQVCKAFGIQAADRVRTLKQSNKWKDGLGALPTGEVTLHGHRALQWLLRLKPQTPEVIAMQLQVHELLYKAMGGGIDHTKITALFAPMNPN